MATTAIKGKVCDLCGADVRDGSQFCYNCGSDLSAASKSETKTADPIAEPASSATKNGAEPLPAAEPERRFPVRPPRTRSRTRTIETRDISWEEPDGISISFIVAAIVFGVLTLTILIVAFYIR